jgi:hypothetical protein
MAMFPSEHVRSELLTGHLTVERALDEERQLDAHPAPL